MRAVKMELSKSSKIKEGFHTNRIDEQEMSDTLFETPI